MTHTHITWRRLNANPWILIAFVLMSYSLAGCGQPATPAVQPAPQASSERPAAVASSTDESLTSGEYVGLGMPADDRDWSSADMVQAHKTLSSLPGGHANLPRYQSDRSGAMFARLTTPQNLELFRNRSLPLEGRLPLALDFGDASTKTFKLYLSAFLSNKVRDSEMIELLGAELRLAVVNVELLGELLPTLDKDDPTYAVRMQGVEQMKRGLASFVMGALQTFDERQSYRQSELLRLADYVRDTFPTLVPFLPPGARTEAKATLKKMLADPAMEPFHAALRDLPGRLESTAADNAERSSAVWMRYHTSDGGCSAEFPKPPKEDSQKLAAGIESKRLVLYLEVPDILYMLTYSEISPDTPASSDEARLDAIRDNLPLVSSQSGRELRFVSEEKIEQKGFPGRDLVYSSGEKYFLRNKVFIVKDRLYRMILVTPRGHERDKDSLRFMDSFEVETGKAEVKP